MGGIGGVRAFSAGEVGSHALREMTDLLHHRPAGSGRWVGSDVGLTHTAPGVLHSPGPEQPMRSRDGRWVVALDGEIVNHAHLRATLDYPFRTDADIEVVLAGLAVDGISFLELLHGPFAVVAHDLRTDSTHLVRDRLGVVPLYYRHVPGAIVFASEVKALLRLDPQPQVDRRSLDAYLRMRSVPAPDTMFEGVKKVRPAHRLTIRSSGHVEESRYWSPPEADVDGTWTDTYAVEAVRDGVRESVRAALVPDVEVGALLSGGLDSSLIVAQAQQLRGDSALRTFSAAFEGSAAGAARARRVSSLLGTDHHEVHLRPDGFEDMWGQLTWHLDAPVSDPEDVVLYALTRAAGEEVGVVLSSDGGDELFAGHPRHRFARLAERRPNLPDRLRSGLATSVERRLGGRLSARAAARAMAGGDTGQLGRLPAPFSADERARLLGAPPPTGRASAPVLGADPVDRMLRHELLHRLPDHLLERDHQIGTAASVELRPALLDHRLVELVFRLPSSVKVRSGVTKWVLREAARSLLPPEVVHHPHVEDDVPLDSCFRAGLRETARERLTGADSWVAGALDPATVRELVARRDGGAAEEARLWTLLCLEQWHGSIRTAPSVPGPRHPVSRPSAMTRAPAAGTHPPRT